MLKYKTLKERDTIIILLFVDCKTDLMSSVYKRGEETESEKNYFNFLK